MTGSPRPAAQGGGASGPTVALDGPAPLARRASRSLAALVVAAVLAAAATVPLGFGFLALPMVGHIDASAAIGALLLGVAGWCAALALAWSGLRALRAPRGRR